MSRPGVVTPCVRRTVARLGVVRNTEAHFKHFRVAWPLRAGERRPRPENETATPFAVPSTSLAELASASANGRINANRLGGSVPAGMTPGISLGVWPLRLVQRTGAFDFEE